MGTRTVLLVGAALLVLLLAGVLVAGALRRPPTFSLQAVVPVPGAEGTVFVSASDDAVWATVVGGVVSIDPKTGVATRYEVPRGGTDITGVVATDDAIWVADYHGARVVRLDRATGQVTAEVPVVYPMNLHLQDSIWVQDGPAAVSRIDPSTAKEDLRLPASSFDVVPGALWYITTADGEAAAVEIDPATGVQRRSIPIPAEAAGSIAIDAAGNPWIYRRETASSTIVAIDAATGTVGTPYEVPYDVIGGIVPIGSSMWALTGATTLTGANTPEGSGIVELGPTGPTGRAETLHDGLDPNNPVIAFGSIWIPWDSHAVMYQYPVDALAP